MHRRRSHAVEAVADKVGGRYYNDRGFGDKPLFKRTRGEVAEKDWVRLRSTVDSLINNKITFGTSLANYTYLVHLY